MTGNAMFKKGDRVVKARPFSETEYYHHGGLEDTVPLGSLGKVEATFGVSELIITVTFDNGVNWNLHPSELDHVNEKGKITVWGRRVKQE